MNNKVYLVICDGLEFVGLYGNYVSAFTDTVSRAEAHATNYFGRGDDADVEELDWTVVLVDPVSRHVLHTYIINEIDIQEDTIFKG